VDFEEDARMNGGLLNLNRKRNERWRWLGEHHWLLKLAGWLKWQIRCCCV